MQVLHRDFIGGSDAVVKVTLDAQANVMLVDDSNFSAYQSRRSFRYHGGWVKSSPVLLRPPHHGRWHVVIDLGGRSGDIRAGIEILN